MPRTGIPMGSTEIGNLGVSSAAAVPTITVDAHHRFNDPDGARRYASGPEHDGRSRGHRSHHGDAEHLRDTEHGTGPVTRRHDVALSGNPTRETQP